MDIAEKIEDAKQSDALLLIVFYTDWSPHYEWIEPLLHEFETPVNIIRVNMEGDKKVADAYNIETAPAQNSPRLFTYPNSSGSHE
jgi:thioredoxin 1